MIILKSPDEIAEMRVAGEIVAGTIAAVTEAVRSGVSTAELDAIGEAYILEQGATPSFKGYKGFPASICVSLNEQIVHGIPGSRKILEHDLVSLDFGAIWHGFHADAAVTVFAGSPPSEEARSLVEVTEVSLQAGIAKIADGAHLTDIGAAVQEVAEASGFSVVREYVGHGIGRSLHEDPQVPNFGPAGRGPKIKEGLVIAIEPMVNVGGWETVLLPDHWTVITEDGSLSAHFEHTIAVTSDGPEVLTRPR
jgi:methionyl aminopeptidase